MIKGDEVRGHFFKHAFSSLAYSCSQEGFPILNTPSVFIFLTIYPWCSSLSWVTEPETSVGALGLRSVPLTPPLPHQSPYIQILHAYPVPLSVLTTPTLLFIP